jgi:STE24 endopeptidase
MKEIKLLLAFFCFFFFSFVHAQQEVGNGGSPNIDSTAINNSIAPAFDPSAATQKYLDILSPAKKAKSDSYFEGGYWLILWNLLYTLAIGFIFLRLGLSKWIRQIAFRAKNINMQVFIYGLLYILFVWLFSFPLTVYQDFYREHQYDLSNLTFSAWLIENLKSLVIAVVFGSALLVLLYKAIRHTGKNWWIWGAGITISFVIFGAFIAPVFLAPIFNKYKPLEEGALKSQILSIARANNIPADNVYQFDASKQSNKISANVSGFASTTRISLNDNLLKRCSPAEIKSVVGHEMGHYVMNHVYKGILEIGLLMFLSFALVNWLFNKIISRWGERLSIAGITDIAGLPLLAVLFALISFCTTPVSNTLTRTQEIESDMFGLNAAREPDGFAAVSMKLSEYRKINPGRWEEIIFFDHPSGQVRVSTAMKWKAENLK